jgi:hypothetical protein
MQNSNFNLEILAAAWNRLDIHLLEPQISENFSYDSQFVFKNIQSKAEFITHLEAKFNAIRILKEAGQMSVIAEMGLVPALNNRTCIILTQEGSGMKEKVLLLLEEDLNFITSINVCFVPDPNNAIRLGIFPM